jgi:hypothetical protein
MGTMGAMGVPGATEGVVRVKGEACCREICPRGDAVLKKYWIIILFFKQFLVLSENS